MLALLAVSEEEDARELGLRWRLLLGSWCCACKGEGKGGSTAAAIGCGGRAHVGGGAGEVQERGRAWRQHLQGKGVDEGCR